MKVFKGKPFYFTYHTVSLRNRSCGTLREGPKGKHFADVGAYLWLVRQRLRAASFITTPHGHHTNVAASSNKGCLGKEQYKSAILTTPSPAESCIAD